MCLQDPDGFRSPPRPKHPEAQRREPGNIWGVRGTAVANTRTCPRSLGPPPRCRACYSRQSRLFYKTVTSVRQASSSGLISDAHRHGLASPRTTSLRTVSLHDLTSELPFSDTQPCPPPKPPALTPTGPAFRSHLEVQPLPSPRP